MQTKIPTAEMHIGNSIADLGRVLNLLMAQFEKSIRRLLTSPQHACQQKMQRSPRQHTLTPRNCQTDPMTCLRHLRHCHQHCQQSWPTSTNKRKDTVKIDNRRESLLSYHRIPGIVFWDAQVAFSDIKKEVLYLDITMAAICCAKRTPQDLLQHRLPTLSQTMIGCMRFVFCI
jgi:hypothetical protein